MAVLRERTLVGRSGDVGGAPPRRVLSLGSPSLWAAAKAGTSYEPAEDGHPYTRHV